MPIFKLAVVKTARKRGFFEEMSEWMEICDDIKQETALERLWNNYRNDNEYASDISFEDVVNNLIKVGNQLERAVNIADTAILHKLALFDKKESSEMLETRDFNDNKLSPVTGAIFLPKIIKGGHP